MRSAIDFPYCDLFGLMITSYFFFIPLSTFKNKNSLRAIEAEISKKVKNNEARPEFTGSYKKACTFSFQYNGHQTRLAHKVISGIHPLFNFPNTAIYVHLYTPPFIRTIL